MTRNTVFLAGLAPGNLGFGLLDLCVAQQASINCLTAAATNDLESPNESP